MAIIFFSFLWEKNLANIMYEFCDWTLIKNKVYSVFCIRFRKKKKMEQVQLVQLQIDPFDPKRGHQWQLCPQPTPPPPTRTWNDLICERKSMHPPICRYCITFAPFWCPFKCLNGTLCPSFFLHSFHWWSIWTCIKATLSNFFFLVIQYRFGLASIYKWTTTHNRWLLPTDC